MEEQQQLLSRARQQLKRSVNDYSTFQDFLLDFASTLEDISSPSAVIPPLSVAEEESLNLRLPGESHQPSKASFIQKNSPLDSLFKMSNLQRIPNSQFKNETSSQSIFSRIKNFFLGGIRNDLSFDAFLSIDASGLTLNITLTVAVSDEGYPILSLKDCSIEVQNIDITPANKRLMRYILILISCLMGYVE